MKRVVEECFKLDLSNADLKSALTATQGLVTLSAGCHMIHMKYEYDQENRLLVLYNIPVGIAVPTVDVIRK